MWGYKKDLKLKDRLYKCSCGLNIDRDLNASINLSKYKLAQYYQQDNADMQDALYPNLRPRRVISNESRLPFIVFKIGFEEQGIKQDLQKFIDIYRFLATVEYGIYRSYRYI